MKYPLFFLLFLSILGIAPVCAQTSAYDTLRVLSYNTLNYGFTSSSCPALITDNKHAWLRTVVNYLQPDIIGLVKMDASPPSFTEDSVIRYALGSNFGHTPYTDYSGYEKENMLYYRKSKVGFSSTTTIYSGDPDISDINLHKLFYLSPSLATTHDTIFLNIILVHLQSGSGDATERATEIQGVMTWLNANVTSQGNYIIMGDFNTQSSNESCYQQLITSANPYTLFYDPVNDLGNWSDTPTRYAQYLTQSPRLNDPGDCGATGGLNDWLDHILCTQYIMQGTDSVLFIPGSFKVIANDGQHVAIDLLADPPDTIVPDSVVNAAYYMSSHLPVFAQLAIGGASVATSVTELAANNRWKYNTLAYDYLSVSPTGAQPVNDCRLTVFDLCGRKINEFPLGGSINRLPVSSLASGTYIFAISNATQPAFTGKFIKVAE